MNAWREQVAFRCDDVRFVPDQNSQVGYLVPAQLKQQSMERHVAPPGQTILIRSQPLNAVCLAILLSLVDRAGAITPDLLYLRRARKPLHHRRGYNYE